MVDGSDRAGRTSDKGDKIMSEYRVSYAQNREDIILSGFFDKLEKGFYVDVGANHPDTLSITKYFYDQGWSGINIEPNPALYKEIVSQRSRDINLNIGAADKAGELTLREYPGGDGLSTFSEKTQASYQEKGSEYKKNTDDFVDRVVPVKPLSQIFAENNVETIQFMNVDVEGFEYEVIAGNDWSKFRPQVICIESNHIVKDWRPLLKKANYELLFFDGLNNYYVANECDQIIKNFSYVKTVLLDMRPIIPAVVNDQLLRLQEVQQQLEYKLARQELIEQSLNIEIHSLHAQIVHNRRLRTLVKQLLMSINGIILMYIEKLNRPKLKQQSPLVVSEKSNTKELAEAIKMYDLDRYYGAGAVHPLSYRIIRGTYLSLYKLAKSAALKLLRIMMKRGK